jgi:hypothetical protein
MGAHEPRALKHPSTCRPDTLTKPAIIQRRSSIIDVQATLDGLAVAGLCYVLITRHIGALTAQYTVFVVLLLCTLGLVYDVFGIYRKSTSFTRKAGDLFQAWCLAFFILMALGFATKQTESFSRLLLGQAVRLRLPLPGPAAPPDAPSVQRSACGIRRNPTT